MMKRVLAALFIGILVAYARIALAIVPSDMAWPQCAARQLLAGADAYGAQCLAHRASDGAIYVVYPFPTVLALVPFTGVSIGIATAIILGLSSALMAYGVLTRGTPSHMLLFLSVPFLHAWFYGQWSPMMLGVALVPSFLVLVPIKPHIGLPMLIRGFTPRRLLGVAVFVLGSLLVLPSWPWRWIALLGTYDGYIPLLTPFGLAVLLLLPRWREEDARYLLLCAIVPQRGTYDPLIVAAVLRTRLDVLVWVAAGWLITFFGWRYLPFPVDWTVVLATHVPAVALVLYRRRHAPTPERSPAQPESETSRP